MKQIARYRILLFLTGLLFSILSMAQQPTDSNSVLSQTLKLPRSKKTVYQLLEQVTKKTGYFFIYDSNLIKNEQMRALKGGKHTLREMIYEIIGNDRLELRVIDSHILIIQPAVPDQTASRRHTLQADSTVSFTLSGTLIDKYTQEPISYGTVSVKDTSIGTVTNQNGEFRLRLSNKLKSSKLSFSHLGYIPQAAEISLLAGRNSTFALEPKIIPLQEVVIRVANPLRLMREMLDARNRNYAQQPVYLTTFYREGVKQKSKFVSLTEAVFKVYKASPLKEELPDQVKLLKMRRISNREAKDTLIAKMKSGIRACLELDIIKSMPDFLTPGDKPNAYIYASSDLTIIDGRTANIVYFEQLKGIKYPLYCGELYIDPENHALLGARFEIYPRYIHKAAGSLVERKSRRLRITPQKVTYNVSYKSWNGTYYIQHIRGDLYFKVRHKKQLFGSTSLHTWFEMATCEIDTRHVNRFGRNEQLSTRTIFADTPYVYDGKFWGDFNVIPPEKELSESIGKISSKIEETDY